MSLSPGVSIIIPTHNRKNSLQQLLQALQSQSFPLQELEVIVVMDKCSDGTEQMLRSSDLPFRLKSISYNGTNVAAVRNVGAAKAEGHLLIFIDDDVVPSAELVKEHVESHTEEKMVIIGYLPPMMTIQKGYFKWKLRNWWEEMFEYLRQPGHRFSHRNLLSGNFSVTRDFFNEVGGFNENFDCQEDYEIGYALIMAGGQFSFNEKAWGFHVETTTLEKSLQRKYAEGKAAVAFLKSHPELLHGMPTLHYLSQSTYHQKLMKEIFEAPSKFKIRCRISYIDVKFREALHQRLNWQRKLDRLLHYYFLKGVADASGSLAHLFQTINDCRVCIREADEIKIELDNGIDKAMEILDLRQPEVIAVFYKNRLIGRTKFKPGFERIKGKHLKRLLVNELEKELKEAITLDNGYDVQKTGICTEITEREF